jgi:hypothetical protein
LKKKTIFYDLKYWEHFIKGLYTCFLIPFCIVYLLNAYYDLWNKIMFTLKFCANNILKNACYCMSCFTCVCCFICKKKLFLTKNKYIHLFPIVSEWLLFNVKWEVFQRYHGKHWQILLLVCTVRCNTHLSNSKMDILWKVFLDCHIIKVWEILICQFTCTVLEIQYVRKIPI